MWIKLIIVIVTCNKNGAINGKWVSNIFSTQRKKTKVRTESIRGL